jgi:hypothetical protein
VYFIALKIDFRSFFLRKMLQWFLLIVLTAWKKVFLAVRYTVLVALLSSLIFLCLDVISLCSSLSSLFYHGLIYTLGLILGITVSAALLIASISAFIVASSSIISYEFSSIIIVLELSLLVE